MDGVESSKSKHLIITFVERKTRYAVAIISPDKSAASISNVVSQFLSKYGHQVRSITHDHWQEFMNSSVGIVLGTYSVQYAMDNLNAKPMKVLQYKSPEQAFTKSVHYQQA